jgi:hypothetical protein
MGNLVEEAMVAKNKHTDKVDFIYILSHMNKFLLHRIYAMASQEPVLIHFIRTRSLSRLPFTSVRQHLLLLILKGPFLLLFNRLRRKRLKTERTLSNSPISHIQRLAPMAMNANLRISRSYGLKTSGK